MSQRLVAHDVHLSEQSNKHNIIYLTAELTWLFESLFSWMLFELCSRLLFTNRNVTPKVKLIDMHHDFWPLCAPLDVAIILVPVHVYPCANNCICNHIAILHFMILSSYDCFTMSDMIVLKHVSVILMLELIHLMQNCCRKQLFF